MTQAPPTLLLAIPDATKRIAEAVVIAALSAAASGYVTMVFEEWKRRKTERDAERTEETS